MNFYEQEEQKYMDEPMDEMSESSYIKINKKFLSCLKGVNGTDDLLRFRQDSDEEDNNNKHQQFSSQQLEKRSAHNNNRSGSSQQVSPSRQSYSTLSPFQSKYYMHSNTNKHNEEKSLNKKSLQKRNNDSNQRQEIHKNVYNFNTKAILDNDLSNGGFKKSPKVSDHSKGERRSKMGNQVDNNNNTFEYYLMRKSHQKKFNDDSKLQSQLDKEEEDNHYFNDKSTNYGKSFSPQFRFSASNRFAEPSFNLQSQMQRINYKKLLENQISKNKQLERHIYKLQSKLTQINLQFDESFKSNKKLQQNIVNSEKVRKQNRHRMKQLDVKLQGLKNIFKNKNNQNQQKMQTYRKQNKLLRQENQKYRIFVETLSESIYILKGHKPKKLQDVWDEWKTIFETFSKKKWTRSIGKSPNSKI